MQGVITTIRKMVTLRHYLPSVLMNRILSLSPCSLSTAGLVSEPWAAGRHLGPVCGGWKVHAFLSILFLKCFSKRNKQTNKKTESIYNEMPGRSQNKIFDIQKQFQDLKAVTFMFVHWSFFSIEQNQVVCLWGNCSMALEIRKDNFSLLRRWIQFVTRARRHGF